MEVNGNKTEGWRSEVCLAWSVAGAEMCLLLLDCVCSVVSASKKMIKPLSKPAALARLLSWHHGNSAAH